MSAPALPGNIDARAEAMLVAVLVAAGVQYSALTQFERHLWRAGYKLGHGQGMLDGVDAAREAVK